MIGASRIERDLRENRAEAERARIADFSAAVSIVEQGTKRLRDEFTAHVMPELEPALQTLHASLKGSVGKYATLLQYPFVGRLNYKLTDAAKILQALDVDPEKFPRSHKHNSASYDAGQWVRALQKHRDENYNLTIKTNMGGWMNEYFITPAKGADGKVGFTIEMQMDDRGYGLGRGKYRTDAGDKRGQIYSHAETVEFFEDKLCRHIEHRRTPGHITKRAAFAAAVLGAVYFAGDKAIDIARDPATEKWIAGFTQDGPKNIL